MEKENQYKNLLLENLAEQYAEYFKVDTSKEKKQIDEELEVLLVKLDEYKLLLNETRSSNQELLHEKVPTIFTYYQSLLRSFQYIDTIGEMMNEVKSDLNTLEETVTKAETDLGIGGTRMVNLLKPLLFKKDQPVASTSSGNITFTPPKLKFDLKKYFPDQDKDSS